MNADLKVGATSSHPWVSPRACGTIKGAPLRGANAPLQNADIMSLDTRTKIGYDSKLKSRRRSWPPGAQVANFIPWREGEQTLLPQGGIRMACPAAAGTERSVVENLFFVPAKGRVGSPWLLCYPDPQCALGNVLSGTRGPEKFLISGGQGVWSRKRVRERILQKLTERSGNV